jgi:hypothetical protein
MKKSLLSSIRLLMILEVLRELTYTYTFCALGDKTCDDCQPFDGQTFDRAQISATFPYAVETGDGATIFPNVHPHCKCLLILLEVGI